MLSSLKTAGLLILLRETFGLQITSSAKSLELLPTRRLLQENIKFKSDIENGIRKGGIYLTIYGDSILQCCRYEVYPCGNSLSIAQQRFGPYHYVGWAVGGDTVKDLFSRIKSGVVPVGINKGNITLVAMLIGHNGLPTGSQESGRKYAQRIIDVYKYLMELDAKIHILSIGILPSGGFGTPYSQDMRYKAWTGANKALQEYAAKNDGKVTYVDCASFVVNGRYLNPKVMPDGTHLNEKGISRMADCLEPTLDKLLGFVKNIPVLDNLMDPATTVIANKGSVWWYVDHQNKKG